MNTINGGFQFQRIDMKSLKVKAEPQNQNPSSRDLSEPALLH